MAKTIGNPLSWMFRQLGGAAGHVSTSVEHLGEGHSPVRPDDVIIHDLSFDDIREALRLGAADMGASRTDAIFIVLIYPVIGILLVATGYNMNLLPLLFPLAAGFALLGPLAAVGLYEISRRREQHLSATWGDALRVIMAPNFGAILVLGAYLIAVFVAWMLVAYAIFAATLGPEPPVSAVTFAQEVLTTLAGWTMIVLGMVAGFGFAALVLATSVVSFPLLLDRDVGLPTAVITSLRVTRENPRQIAAWGLVVALGLLIGSIPAFIGLIVVMPILGHATWHLYRRAVTV